MAAVAPGGAVSFSSSGSCSNVGANFTMTSGTGTCTVQYDQAGERELQRRAADHRIGYSAEGQPGDHRHDPCSGERRLQHELRRGGDGRRLGQRGDVLERRRLHERRCNVHDDERHRAPARCKYDQAGDANYNAAPQVTESVNAQKAAQSISVTTHAPATAAVRRRASRWRPSAADRATWSPSRAAASARTSPGTFTMTSGTGTCIGQVRPGRRRQLQRRPAGHRVASPRRRLTRRSRSVRCRTGRSATRTSPSARRRARG